MSVIRKVLIVSALGSTLVACAPPGYQQLPFTAVSWPSADQPMTPGALLQVEQILVRLGYMRGGADGAITAETRESIRAFQRDIGAPETGYVSQPLLDSLLVNSGGAVQAPAVVAVRTAPAAGVPSAQVSPPAAAPSAAPQVVPQAAASPVPVVEAPGPIGIVFGPGGGDGPGWR